MSTDDFSPVPSGERDLPSPPGGLAFWKLESSIKMDRPPFGICLPVEFRRCRDGDTVEVGIAGSEIVWPVRLLDCWAPEMSLPEGRAAKQYAEKLMEQCARPVLWLPIAEGVKNLLAAFLSFDRLLGHIFISETMTLSEAMVNAGHATATKQKPAVTVVTMPGANVKWKSMEPSPKGKSDV